MKKLPAIVLVKGLYEAVNACLLSEGRRPLCYRLGSSGYGDYSDAVYATARGVGIPVHYGL